MTAYEEIIKLLTRLLLEVLKDIERRTRDWMWSASDRTIRIFVSTKHSVREC
ncbi:DUF6877 family protein [Sporosarcina psychrophila]|uniref:DUF6877 family protein n=1 Tax=Sporosarcina TaxID=1569 RepID=UPI003BAF4C4F